MRNRLSCPNNPLIFYLLASKVHFLHHREFQPSNILGIFNPPQTKYREFQPFINKIQGISTLQIVMRILNLCSTTCDGLLMCGKRSTLPGKLRNLTSERILDQPKFQISEQYCPDLTFSVRKLPISASLFQTMT